MNVTKYADLSQELAKSEEQLYDKISEDFETAICPSVKKIKDSVDSMTEVVDKVQSCKESYGEAAEIVGKLSDTLNENKEILIKVTNDIQGTEETINDVSKSFCQLEERVDAYNKRVVDEIDGHLSSVKQEIDIVVGQTDRFSALLLKNSAEVTGLIDSQQKWKKSCDEAFDEVMKSVELLIADLNENKESICSNTESMREYQRTIQFCVDDVKRSTDEYVKLTQEASSSLVESLAIFKNDFLTVNNEQIRLISELKEGQLKQKKMYLLGLIPVIIIILLQIINILG